jgi:hypothetical protein
MDFSCGVVDIDQSKQNWQMQICSIWHLVWWWYWPEKPILTEANMFNITPCMCMLVILTRKTNIDWDKYVQYHTLYVYVGYIDQKNHYYMTINISFIWLAKSRKFFLGRTLWILSRPSISTNINCDRSRGAFGTLY